MPTRRDQVDPDQQKRWAESRRRVGANVRRLRLERGLTQEALALESGLSRNQLIELEHGRRGVLFERLEDLAVVLQVEPGTFLLRKA
ncbi:helix-turn-helix transcriptional regulator [Calidifontibacter sp. DB0510]|uniref:Helix-turn-helix transcriptional regulator n=1 Tax=Metallococcus carri TaxID=1656884 RepID=A0A967EFP4_9MICO|nr:helix-turn-helix transcriptional regulator [Metallococcus carri]NOP37802.1 helix-turn-helix transcriptional regulator [Calidifontibacter sp. DB2511S]